MRNYTKGISLVVLATLCWATSSILINLIVRVSGISAVSLAFWRDLTTSVVLVISILLFRRKLFSINRENLPWLIGMGVISIGLFHVLWNTSVVLFGASVATVLQSNAPIFVTIIARFVFSEPINPRKIAAVAFSVIGTILSSGITKSGVEQISTLGLLVALGSAIAYGTFPLFGRKIAGDTTSFSCFLPGFSVFHNVRDHINNRGIRHLHHVPQIPASKHRLNHRNNGDRICFDHGIYVPE